MKNLKDKLEIIYIKTYFGNTEEFYSEIMDDIRNAILRFDDFIYNSYEDKTIEEFKLELFEKIKEIFGDWEE